MADYQGEKLRKVLFKLFQKHFGDQNVKTKWRASSESADDFDSSYIYTPETDIVIGPFNTNRRIEENNSLIDLKVSEYASFFSFLNRISSTPYQNHLLNKNPRCFLAIEVAGSGSEKHLLGDMFNASIIGKIGIVIGTTPEIVKSYMRLYEYVNYVHTVGKIDQTFGNLAILLGSDMLTVIETVNNI